MNGILSAFLMVITYALSFILIRKIELRFSTVFINLIRALIGLCCFVAYNLLTKGFHLIFNLNLRLWGILGAGIIFGMVVGDTAYFKCQMRIGPTNAATFAITSPIFTMVLAILILGHSFQWILLFSSLLTGAGVYLLVHLQKEPDVNHNSPLNVRMDDEREKKELKKKNLLLGSLFGLIASLAWSFANIYTEMGMELSEENLHIGSEITMVTNIIRYIIATTCMSGWWIMAHSQSKKKKKPQEHTNIESTPKGRSYSILIFSAILGTFLGEIFFGLTIVQLGSTFIAIMGSSLPVFTIPLNYIVNKEKIDYKSLPGIIITLAGVLLLIIGTA
ncbi:DMT family transporter [Candidatus Lokiarchaeum ossiferum]|uniref:DMT family transporter n=1 Tax=Candidatus Lokiarchaeum ossiferum TaxID=2951803 RepID=UPI00352FA5FB